MRLRNKNLVKLHSTSVWQLSSTLYEGADGKPRHLGEGILTQPKQVAAHFILYKGKAKNRHKLNIEKTNSRAGKSKRYAKAHKEPWLLVTSLTESAELAKKTVNIYRQRMRIEENFRDTKCTRYGFGLKESRSRSVGRMNVLLLIGANATFACWLASILTRQKGNAADYQAHSSKFTSVLSSVYLGRETLKRGIRVGVNQFKMALQLLFDINAKAQLEVPIYG